jgi:hypothetical protein
MNHDSLYSFVFRGLLTEEALDKAGRQHRNVFSEVWESETSNRLAIPFLDEELVKKSRKMAVVYTAICAFESFLKKMERSGGSYVLRRISDRELKIGRMPRKTFGGLLNAATQ